MTGSSFYTGLAGFLVKAPSGIQFLFGPLVDRYQLRNILVGTQSIQCVCVLAVPFAAMIGHLNVWVVLLIMPVLSLINQIVYPAQVAVLPRIVSDENLVRANSLFSSAYKGTEVLFNAASGVILTVLGATTLFVLDSITFAVAAILFAGVIVPATDSDDADSETDESYFTELREGIDYLRGSVVMTLIMGGVVANLGTGAMLAVLPQFADSIGGPETYGLLMAAIAGGQFAGIAVATLAEDWPYGLVSIAGFALSGICLFTALLVPGRLPTVGFFFATFVPIGTFNVIFASMLQSSVDNALLGRVSSVVSSVTGILMPVGTLLGGAGGEIFSPPLIIQVFAGIIVLLAIYFFVRPQLRSLPSVSETDERTLGLRSSDIQVTE